MVSVDVVRAGPAGTDWTYGAGTSYDDIFFNREQVAYGAGTSYDDIFFNREQVA